jgi:transposase
MITPPPGVRIWLAAGVTDMRRGFDGLAAMVQQTLALDPFSGQLFVFRGRRGQRATFYIQFAVCEDCLSLASAVRSHASGISLSARQGSEVYLHEGAAGPLP